MRRKICLVCSGLILAVLILIFILPNLGSSGRLELLEVKDEKVGIINCKIFYVKWYGRTTELEFTLYKRTRVAGHAVPGYVTAQWTQAGIFGKTVSVKDGDICVAKNGDMFKLSIPIFACYVKIAYDNKTAWFHGSGEMEVIKRNE